MACPREACPRERKVGDFELWEPGIAKERNTCYNDIPTDHLKSFQNALIQMYAVQGHVRQYQTGLDCPVQGQIDTRRLCSAIRGFLEAKGTANEKIRHLMEVQGAHDDFGRTHGDLVSNTDFNEDMWVIKDTLRLLTEMSEKQQNQQNVQDTLLKDAETRHLAYHEEIHTQFGTLAGNVQGVSRRLDEVLLSLREETTKAQRERAQQERQRAIRETEAAQERNALLIQKLQDLQEKYDALTTEHTVLQEKYDNLQSTYDAMLLQIQNDTQARYAKKLKQLESKLEYAHNKFQTTIDKYGSLTTSWYKECHRRNVADIENRIRKLKAKAPP